MSCLPWQGRDAVEAALHCPRWEAPDGGCTSLDQLNRQEGKEGDWELSTSCGRVSKEYKQHDCGPGGLRSSVLPLSF